MAGGAAVAGGVLFGRQTKDLRKAWRDLGRIVLIACPGKGGGHILGAAMGHFSAPTISTLRACPARIAFNPA